MNAVCDHDHLHSGLDGARLDRALSEAEARVVSAGERMTPPRRRVLSLLLESGDVRDALPQPLLEQRLDRISAM